MTFDKKALRHSSVSRQTSVKRNAIVLTILAFLIIGGISVLSFIGARQVNDWQAYADGGAVAVLAVLCIIAMILAIKAKFRQATLTMIYSTIAILFVRTFLLNNLGIPFAVIAATATAMIALLALPSRTASRIVQIGLACGSVMVIIDMLWPLTRPEPSSLTAATAQISALAFGMAYLLVVVVRFQRFGLYAKFLLALTFAALIPAIAVGAWSTALTRTAVVNKANQVLLNSAKQTALIVDGFLTSNLDAVRTEAQSPVFQEYLTSLPAGTIENLEYPDKAISTLRALAKKDPFFIESYALLNSRGVVVIDTDVQGINSNESQYEFFYKPLNSGVPYASPMLISAEGKPYLVFSSPVRNVTGNIIGMLRVRYKGIILQQLVARQNSLAGDTSFAMLLDENNIIIANGTSPDQTIKTLTSLPPETLGSLQKKLLLPANAKPEELSINIPDLEQNLASKKTNFLFNIPGTVLSQKAGAFADVAQQPWKVVFMQNADILFEPIRIQTRSNNLLAAIIVFIAAFSASAIARLLTAPVLRLTATSEQISQGHLELRAKVETEDEIGSLANTFNSMTAKLSETIESLETRVEERTRMIERRALLMQAATEVGRNAASLRDRNALLSQTTRLISQRFGYYHAGIFLVDERGEYAVLQAANSEGGQRMLRRGHRLKVGQTGIVGFVTGRGQARIALDVGEDASYFNNPDLPRTRSEMALPLIASGRILGALDVQSELPNAFAEEDIATLQVMADQIAIAIENSRLFEESQAALDAARRAYGEISHKGWQQLMQTRKTEIGYISLPENRIVPTSGAASPEFAQAIKSARPTLANNRMTLFVPVKAREEVIGAIRLDKPESGIQWTDKDIETAGALSEQLGTALESARLYNESSERAEREAAISDITAKIGASIQIDTILRTAVQELGQALSETEVVLQLGNATAKGKRRE